jgi:hypothetical protein
MQGVERLLSGSANGRKGSRIAAGIPIARYPRTDPSERNSCTGLPPWVSNGKALFGPRMKDSGFRKPGVGDLRDPCPRHAILLAAPPKRATPEISDVVAECTECLGVRGHRVVRKEVCDHLLEPSALFGASRACGPGAS